MKNEHIFVRWGVSWLAGWLLGWFYDCEDGHENFLVCRRTNQMGSQEEGANLNATTINQSVAP